MLFLLTRVPSPTDPLSQDVGPARSPRRQGGSRHPVKLLVLLFRQVQAARGALTCPRLAGKPARLAATLRLLYPSLEA